MAGKQAKVLSRQQVIAALRHVRRSRYPQRDRVMILLSVKAGLRAGEIAKLTWPMLLDPDGRIADHIELYDRAAKKRSGPSSSPRATSGSSVPDQSRAARSRYRRAAGERARPRGPRTDQSSAANDRPEHAF